jgi:hypothetical protein
MARRIAARAGRRGSFLAFLAILDLAYGYSLFYAPAGERVFDLFLPWQVWGIAWAAVGLLCAARVLAARDRIAFTAAACIKAAWALLFADVWIFQHYPAGWVSVVVWAAFGGAVLIISGWPEPPRAATASEVLAAIPAEVRAGLPPEILAELPPEAAP